MVGGHATVGRLSNNVFWTFQAMRRNFENSRATVTQQWSEVTRPSADCQTHICMNKREREGEREGEREYLRYTSYGHRHVVLLAVSSAGVPVEAGSCWCESVARSHGSAIGRDIKSMNIVYLHIGKLNLCYVTYIHNGKRER